MGKNIRRCTGVIIYRKNEESEKYEVCLIQSEKFRQQETGTLLYHIPGGKIDEVDYTQIEEADPKREEKAVEACAIRETKEEVDLDLENIVLLQQKTKTGKEMGFKDPTMNFVLYDFIAEGKGAIRIGKELVHADWYVFDQLPEPMAPYMRQLLEHAYETHIKPLRK